MSEYDNIVPKEKWEFDSEVTKVFNNMLERSIPQYSEMRKLTVNMVDSCYLRNKDTFKLLDLGCSNGLNLREFIVKYGARGHYVGVDCSESMLDDFNDKFKLFIDTGIVESKFMDLRTEYPNEIFDVTTLILTLCFIPIQYRQYILNNVYQHLIDGGVLIVVEKVLGSSLLIDNSLVENYYELKRENGYTEEQIERKRLSLEGVQIPIMSSWNIEMLKTAGFSQIDTFWRWMNFVGYIAIK